MKMFSAIRFTDYRETYKNLMAVPLPQILI